MARVVARARGEDVMMDLLKEFVQSVLLERRAEERVGHVTQNDMDQLTDFVDKGCYIHFSHYNKVGMNPKSGFHTPFGFYTYPLDMTTLADIRRGSVPFAQDREWLLVVKPKDPSRVLTLGDVTLEQAMEVTGLNEEELSLMTDHAVNDGTPGERLWVYSMLQSKDIVAWNAWFRKRGIDGVYDNGLGIIHPNEPYQAVFFRVGALEHVASLKNPILKDRNSAVAERLKKARVAFRAFDAERKRLGFRTFKEWDDSFPDVWGWLDDLNKVAPAGFTVYMDTAEALAASESEDEFVKGL